MSRVLQQRRITLKGLAVELGVSAMTVSNAFNRPDQLSAALRRRILDHAHERGYPGPDPLARGLRRGRTGAIGLISDTNLSYAFDDPAASAVIAGVCAAAEQEQLGLLLVPHGGAAGPVGRRDRRRRACTPSRRTTRSSHWPSHDACPR